MAAWFPIDEDDLRKPAFYTYRRGAWGTPLVLGLADDQIAKRALAPDDRAYRQYERLRSQGRNIAEALRAAFRTGPHAV
jgi:hypothetical protein